MKESEKNLYIRKSFVFVATMLFAFVFLCNFESVKADESDINADYITNCSYSYDGSNIRITYNIQASDDPKPSGDTQQVCGGADTLIQGRLVLDGVTYGPSVAGRFCEDGDIWAQKPGDTSYNVGSLSTGSHSATFSVTFGDLDNCGSSSPTYTQTRSCQVYNFNTGCTPNCSNNPNVCQGTSYADGCGGLCWGTKSCCPTYPAPSNLSPSGAITPGVRNVSWTFTNGANLAYLRIDDTSNGWVGNCSLPQNAGDVCLDGLAASNYSYNFQTNHSYSIWVHQGTSTCPPGTLTSTSVSVPNRLPTCSINATQCGTISGTATDPDGGSVLLRIYHDGSYLKDAYLSTTFTAVADQVTHTIRAIPIDAQTGQQGTPCTSTYFKYNTANYLASRCDTYYEYFVNGVAMNWGAGSENKYGYLDGGCGSASYNVSPINYSYHSGDCTLGAINWKARIKGIMQDGGTVNLRVVGHNDNYRVNFTGPCNNPVLATTRGQETFNQTKEYQCSVPQGIGFDPEKLTFDYTDVTTESVQDVNAYIECTLNNEISNITTNTVQVNKGELEACFNVDLTSQSAPYNIYTVSDNYLVSRCDGVVGFRIDDYLYDGENWGPMTGSLSLYYNPATSNTSERFEYSGDVIVNPPPGFEEFIFPSF